MPSTFINSSEVACMSTTRPHIEVAKVAKADHQLLNLATLASPVGPFFSSHVLRSYFFTLGGAFSPHAEEG